LCIFAASAGCKKLNITIRIFNKSIKPPFYHYYTKTVPDYYVINYEELSIFRKIICDKNVTENKYEVLKVMIFSCFLAVTKISQY